MILKRTMDAAFLNSVANHPDVRPWLGGAGQIDLGRVIANPANVALAGRHGGFLGMKVQDGIYECHSLFLPEGRGAFAREAAAAGLRYLFAVTDCMEVVTKCPANNAATLGLARTMGFVAMFERQKAWLTGDESKVDVAYMALSYWKWLARDEQVLARGKWFHTRLEQLTGEMGVTIPVHAEDAAHERAVGACVLMLEAGNPAKAVEAYNRWARVAGQYSEIRLISLNPVIIETDGVLLALKGSDMDVLKVPTALPRQDGETCQ